MNKNKKFIYMPSFQIGALGTNAKNNRSLGEIDAKFWSKDFPEQFRYPYFLLTAGHSFRDLETRNKFGLQDAFVLGDSGGFQISSGALDWENRQSRESIRSQIFNWLETNSDVAVNLDIPPRMKYEGKYEECLKMSIDNFKYFEKNQTGSTKFLNVLQGVNFETYNKWYNEVKDFEFKGWAIGGGATNVHRFFSSITVLVKNKEHFNNKREFFHILGASSPVYFFLLAQLQKSLNDVGSDVTLMVDSSTPNMMSKYGTYATGYDLKRLSVSSVNLPKKPTVEVEAYKNYPLPFVTEYDIWLNKQSNLEQMVEFTGEQYIGFVHHNLYVYLKMKEEIEYFVNGPKYILEQVTTKDLINILKILDEIVKSDDPEKVFKKNSYFIEKFSSTFDNNYLTTQEDVKQKFFK